MVENANAQVAVIYSVQRHPKNSVMKLPVIGPATGPTKGASGEDGSGNAAFYWLKYVGHNTRHLPQTTLVSNSILNGMPKEEDTQWQEAHWQVPHPESYI